MQPTPTASKQDTNWFLWNLPISFVATSVAFTVVNTVNFLATDRGLDFKGIVAGYLVGGGPCFSVLIWLVGSVIIFLLQEMGLKSRLLTRLITMLIPMGPAFAYAESGWIAAFLTAMIAAFGLVARLPGQKRQHEVASST